MDLLSIIRDIWHQIHIAKKEVLALLMFANAFDSVPHNLLLTSAGSECPRNVCQRLLPKYMQSPEMGIMASRACHS